MVPQLNGWQAALDMFLDGIKWGIEQARLRYPN
jgi:hypothetical protein